ncbi:GNAT family N-acetyltransferase [Streptomyces shenzhenensis]|uniref:GNAT family N-acetyltransferase n=1 Tax=Streptomyces shenzhenensis TaxID=943815 RepID=UPI0033CCA864
MSPADASTDTGPVPVHPGSSGPGGDSEETLDLRLPAELIALIAGEPRDTDDSAGAGLLAAGDERGLSPTGAGPGFATDAGRRSAPDTGSLFAAQADLPSAAQAGPPSEAEAGSLFETVAHSSAETDARSFSAADAALFSAADDDLLDHVAGWGPTGTSVGLFQLVPVRLDHDLPLISRWMNDPAVAAFWDLAGSQDRTEEHLCAQLTGDGRSVPCLGTLDGTPMSYWEIYRADLDPLARHYPARPHDTGIHLLIGGVADRGRGLGSVLLRAVAELILSRRPACARVIAEPDLRNTPSMAAFLSAGFRLAAEVDLPAKRAGLMIRDRSLRDVL